MKKARIMLAAIALFAGIGSILAFKTKDKLGSFIYSTTTTGVPATSTVLDYTLTVVPGAATTTGYYTTIFSATVSGIKTAYVEL